jgi:hypothetical protein
LQAQSPEFKPQSSRRERERERERQREIEREGGREEGRQAERKEEKKVKKKTQKTMEKTFKLTNKEVRQNASELLFLTCRTDRGEKIHNAQCRERAKEGYKLLNFFPQNNLLVVVTCNV